VGYTAWFLSLPLLSPIVGLLVARLWALALVLIPALATAPFWGEGCGGDDVCIGALVYMVLLPLCGIGIGIGVLVRRAWAAARRARAQAPPR
jgi:hypothetical protein